MEHFSQFKLRHSLLALTTFALAGGVYPREPWLGASLLAVTAGFWLGFLLLMLSNVTDSSNFEYRSPINQTAVAAGQILISACGTICILLWLFVTLGILQFVVGF